MDPWLIYNSQNSVRVIIGSHLTYTGNQGAAAFIWIEEPPIPEHKVLPSGIS